MTLLADNRIEITVTVNHGHVAALRIQPRPLIPVGEIAAGKTAAELVALMPRLFSLCGAAHQVAALTALDAARGIDPSSAEAWRRQRAVLAERLVDLLRSTVLALDSPSAQMLVGDLRAVMKAAQMFSLSLPDNAAAADARRLAMMDIVAALRRMALTQADLADSARRTRWRAGEAALARHLEGLAGEDWHDVSTQDIASLQAEDDRRVVAALATGGRSYAAAPLLDGAPRQTGAFARQRDALDGAERAAGILQSRLAARLMEIVAVARHLGQEQEAEDGDAVVAALPLGAGEGAAAVECARGRLHHRIELDGDGRVARFDYVAPTEWNFHPDGLLARILPGTPLAGDEAAARRVERLIGALDPCVGYRVTVREAADA